MFQTLEFFAGKRAGESTRNFRGNYLGGGKVYDSGQQTAQEAGILGGSCELLSFERSISAYGFDLSVGECIFWVVYVCMIV